MITALDTNVLLDVFGDDPSFKSVSQAAVRKAIAEGSLVACDVVWAEIVGAFGSESSAKHAMETLGVAYLALDVASALSAGSAWKAHRRRGGTRTRMIPDFLIGAHALISADRLLTRDRGFYKVHFAKLRVLDPSRP